MKTIVTILIVLFSFTAFSQDYSITRNDFRLEFLRGTQVRASMLLEDLRWIDRNGGEQITIFDGVQSFTLNDEQIISHASIAALKLDLEAWRLLAVTRVSGDTLFIGNDTLLTGAGGLMDSIFNVGTGAWLTDGDTIQGYIITEVDGSITNEIDSIYDANQSLWLKNNDTIAVISGGGGFTDTLTVEAITLIQDSVNLPYATADLLFGSPSLNDDGDANHDARMFFDKSLGAFYAGEALSTQWDSRGGNSVNLGRNSTATGNRAVTLGNANTSSGTDAFTVGSTNIASQSRTVSVGNNNTSSGTESIAIGEANNATAGNTYVFGRTSDATASYAISIGNAADATATYAMTFGANITAKSHREIVLGSYNTSYTPASTTLWDASDRLFSVGDGESGALSDALTIMKSGKVSVGIDNFEASDDGGQILHINGSMIVMAVTALGSGDDTLTTADYHVVKTAAGAASADTIYLPDLSAGAEGSTFIIVDGSYNATTNPFVVAALPSGDDTINNTTDVPINSNGGHLTVFWYNNNYYIREN